MNPLLATAARSLRQLRHDPRSVAMIVAVPVVLLTLLYYMFSGQRLVFGHVAPVLLALFPFIIMFLITSIAMLRERTGGTLERLMTTRIRAIDLLGGYGLAFGVLAALQAALAAGISAWWFGLDTAGGLGLVILTAVLTALLGVGLGLFCSAFARTEFQAVQMLPVVVIPQLLLCGLFVARSAMAGWLRGISDVLPLSYAVEAMQEVDRSAAATATLWRDLGILAGCVILALALAAATMRRRTA